MELKTLAYLILYFIQTPTSSDITIDLGDIKTAVRATLTNCFGQVVFTKEFETNRLINVNMDISPGVYFLQLKTGNGEPLTIKVVKE